VPAVGQPTTIGTGLGALTERCLSKIAHSPNQSDMAAHSDSEAGSATSRKQVLPCRGKSSLFERGDEAKSAAGVQIPRAAIVHQLSTPHITRCWQAAACSRATQKTGRRKNRQHTWVFGSSHWRPWCHRAGTISIAPCLGGCHQTPAFDRVFQTTGASH
jgi:hypothetical protein